MMMIGIIVATYLLTLICDCLPVEDRHSTLYSINKVNKKCNISDDVYTFEQINSDKVEHDRRKRVALYDYKWPKSSDGYVYIPYQFNDPVRQETRKLLEQVVERYNENTCIRFQPWSHERNYVKIHDHLEGCWAWMGMLESFQMHQHNVSLEYPGCFREDTYIHELMHVLGIDHTMVRIDRDDYITIHEENIDLDEEDIKVNFDKHEEFLEVVSGLPFNYHSVMMYGNYDFSKNGKKVITAKHDPDMEFINNKWTESDVKEINRLYECKGYHI